MKKTFLDKIPVVEVYYNNKFKNWDEVIDAELKRRGLLGKPCRVIAYPSKEPEQVKIFN